MPLQSAAQSTELCLRPARLPLGAELSLQISQFPVRTASCFQLPVLGQA